MFEETADITVFIQKKPQIEYYMLKKSANTIIHIEENC